MSKKCEYKLWLDKYFYSITKINLGPNSCYWYTIDAGYGAEFRQAKKDLYAVDIHKDGDLWSGDIDFCLRNRIKIEYFVQEPGDIVNIA